MLWLPRRLTTLYYFLTASECYGYPRRLTTLLLLSDDILTIPGPVRDSSSWFLKTSPQSLNTASSSTSYILDILSASSRNPSAWFPNQPSTNPDTRSYCWEVSNLPSPESTQPACRLRHWLLIRKHLLLPVLRIFIPTLMRPTGGPPFLDSQPATNHHDYMN